MSVKQVQSVMMVCFVMVVKHAYDEYVSDDLILVRDYLPVMRKNKNVSMMEIAVDDVTHRQSVMMVYFVTEKRFA